MPFLRALHLDTDTVSYLPQLPVERCPVQAALCRNVHAHEPSSLLGDWARPHASPCLMTGERSASARHQLPSYA